MGANSLVLIARCIMRNAIKKKKVSFLICCVGNKSFSVLILFFEDDFRLVPFRKLFLFLKENFRFCILDSFEFCIILQNWLNNPNR